ncbi:MAG: 3-hydroxybutyryl-CoA dehydrogenase [Candidatus Neomarinimicrobiota bacterium]|nr:3-hydroxybutyryl-CoA dehydrogenase [Candidatus Neomarinimicrobiota bacterium]
MKFNIGIIGAGAMGNGIAHTFAQHNYSVLLVDINSKLLEKSIKLIEQNMDRQVKKNIISAENKKNFIKNITCNTDISLLKKSDLVIEAVTESLNVKLDIFKKLDKLCPEHTIFATNTSSISITKIAAQTNRPDRVIGMHFMNPVPVMKLVEVIRGYLTSDATLKKICDISKSLNKIPIECNDYPGFVANRILMPMINEAIYCKMEGVAEAESIDQIIKLGMAHPMGPLALADLIGLDVCLAILEVLYEEMGDSKYSPCPLLKKMVNAGVLGRKTGRGFYKY